MAPFSMPRCVSNKPLRRRFEELQRRDGLTARELARLLGWRTKKGEPDASNVQRSLGITVSTSKSKKYKRTLISHGKAREMGEVLGLDPVDMGF